MPQTKSIPITVNFTFSVWLLSNYKHKLHVAIQFKAFLLVVVLQKHGVIFQKQYFLPELLSVS